MLKVVLSPQWFFGPDILIDFFSFVVLFLFAIISLKYYGMSKNKGLLYLGISFFLVGLGELSRIIMNFGLYYNFTVTYNIGKMIVTSEIVKSIDVIYGLGFFFYRFFVMLGFYFIYYINKKKKSRIEHLIMIYFILIAAIFTSNAYGVFHMTVTVFLAVIFAHYWKVYKKTKSENTHLLAAAFLVLVVSNVIMIFSRLNAGAYLVANLMELGSYILFLFVIIRIYKHGRHLNSKSKKR